ncbi:RNase H domain-containing protein [Trichonephila clavipes]|nr:RNase H domain-containing protein [Trichonephila clavipes]
MTWPYSGLFVASSIEHHSLFQIIEPSEGLDGVYFHVDLSILDSKQKELPRYLKQLALERIDYVPKDAVHMYTDAVNLLVEILVRLNTIELLPQLHDIWIFSDSRSAIQHLANWHNVRDCTGTDILKILKRFSISRQIHFQRIPSHVNIAGNEIADSLARPGAGKTTTPATRLTYLELFSEYKAKNKAIWMIPPVHPWYQSKCPGDSWCGAAVDEIKLRLLVSLVVI